MTWNKLQAAAAFALLVGLFPAIAAYEASLVNVTSHVAQPPPPSQNHTTAAEWGNFQEDGYILAYHPALAFEGEWGNWDHTRVFVGEVACWEFALTITNTYPYEMGEVAVFDKYGAMRMSDGAFLVDAVDVYRRVPTGGQILTRPENPDSFTEQIEFTWYPGLDSGEPGPTDPGFLPSYSELAPGEVQKMTLTLCTKQNPSFDQEFTTPGLYQMNEGATFSWLNPQGHRFNSVEKLLQVEAIIREVNQPEVGNKEQKKAGKELKKAEEKAGKERDKAEDKATKEQEHSELEAELENGDANSEAVPDQADTGVAAEQEQERADEKQEKAQEKAEAEVEKEQEKVEAADEHGDAVNQHKDEAKADKKQGKD